MSDKEDIYSHIDFELEYKPNLAGGPSGKVGSELYPVQLEVFGTHELSPDPRRQTGIQIVELVKAADVHRVKVDIKALKQQQPFLPYREGGAYGEPAKTTKTDQTVILVVSRRKKKEGGKLSDNKQLYDPLGESLANSTALIVRAYATTFSESGQACLTTVGEATFLVRDLLKGRTDRKPVIQNHDATSSFVPTRPLTKGTVQISKVNSRLPWVRDANKFDVDNNVKAVQPQLTAMIERNLATFFGKHAWIRKPTLAALQPFHCPAFTTARAAVVSQAYTHLRPRAQPNLLYYENIVRIGMRRSFGFQEAEDDVVCLATEVLAARAPPSATAAFGAFVARCATVFATSQVYVSDFVNRNSSRAAHYTPRLIECDEDFKVTRRLGGDDCEGVALECHMFVRQLQLASDFTANQMSPLLRSVRDFLLLYVSCMTLGAVTNKKLTTGYLNPDDVMAHTFCTLMPLQTLYARSDKKMRGRFDKSSTFSSRAERLRKAPKELPMLVCEGTALIDPAMRAVADYYGSEERELEAQAVNAMEARRRFFDKVVRLNEPAINVEIFQAPDRASGKQPLSMFYKYPTSFSTADFDDIGFNDFALVYARDNIRQRTYGVSFETFVAAEFDVMPTLEVSKDEAKMLDAVLLDLPPVPNLELPRDRADPRPPSSMTKELRECAELIAELRAEGKRGVHTMLHSRQLVLSVRREDADGFLLRRLQALLKEPDVADGHFEQYTLAQATDGTGRMIEIFDFYFQFK